MADKSIPTDAPPSYDQVTGSSSSSSRPRPHAQTTNSGSHLAVPGRKSSVGQADYKGGIPPMSRRSMEDESRPLPKGWVRTFDPESSHQFFVDTTKDPPRSIWVHPYDDDEYLSTLSGEERERIEQETIGRRMPSKADLMAEHTDEEDISGPSSPNQRRPEAELPPRPDMGKKKESSLGRRLKDKVTGSTHEEREAQRARRADEERRIYEQHMKMRQAMAEAQRTGQPQYIGKDRQGKDVYIEPPAYQAGPGYYGGGGYGYNPYGGGYGGYGGVYSTPNARYIRPSAPYGRPYGAGYGGGYGLPLAGGLLAGGLLGAALF